MDKAKQDRIQALEIKLQALEKKMEKALSEAEALKQVKVVYIPLRDWANGFICARDGKVAILINSEKDQETQQKALHHELLHYRLNHLNDSRPYEILEAEVDNILKIEAEVKILMLHAQ